MAIASKTFRDRLADAAELTNYKRHPFTEVTNAYCRLFDLGTGEELVHFALTGSEPRTGAP